MSIDRLMEAIATALPETTRRGRRTVREVCLTYDQESWRAIAGGHPAVHIGEWGGDFKGEGETAEAALTALMNGIKSAGRI
ncbi:hypothetical protein CT676_35925 [Bradyrhizobium sp. MOS001]|uniref:hypothetical protein n=1 Tax=Bradyrhizobium sp. MOS001 TaxID=2133948 RepID=UPI001074B6A3|nr:hypothetical protein [Bradyrhizobium sp. MOS001]TFW56249.1 hypothetical protein CT676_35925 [Bradyrhizobium sp. MOS001]